MNYPAMLNSLEILVEEVIDDPPLSRVRKIFITKSGRMDLFPGAELEKAG
jgi:hypothetical protein